MPLQGIHLGPSYLHNYKGKWQNLRNGPDSGGMVRTVRGGTHPGRELISDK